MSPTPGDLVVPTTLRIVSPPSGSPSRILRFREWSVREPAIVIAVNGNSSNTAVLTLMIVRTRRTWTLEVERASVRQGSIRVINPLARRVP